MAKETLSNNNTIEINSDLTTVDTEIHNPGLVSGNFDFEKTVFKLSFRSKINKPLKIGTVSVGAAENTKFIKSPEFQQNRSNRRNNNGTLVPVLKKKVRDSKGNITSYLYDLVYTAKKQYSSTQRYKLHAKTKDIPTIPTGITRVHCAGSYNLRSTGENRTITVYGAPNTDFVLSVNQITDHVDETQPKVQDELGLLKHYITNSNEESITNVSGSETKPSVNVFGDLSEEKVFYGNTGSKGKYVYRQIFPSSTTTTRYTINIKNHNISTKFNTKDWKLRDDKWSGWYSKELKQYANPKLTLRLTTTEGVGNIGVDIGNGVLRTFNNSTPIDIVYNGVYGLRRPVVKKVKYVFSNLKGASSAFSLLSGSGAAVSFTNAYGETETTSDIKGLPEFNRSRQSTVTNPSVVMDGSATVVENGTSWTNAVASKNGGTLVDITNISGALSTKNHANDTYTLTFNLHILSWGTEDVTMALAQDKIILRS